jgi:hypothetical protein
MIFMREGADWCVADFAWTANSATASLGETSPTVSDFSFLSLADLRFPGKVPLRVPHRRADRRLCVVFHARGRVRLAFRSLNQTPSQPQIL